MKKGIFLNLLKTTKQNKKTFGKCTGSILNGELLKPSSLEMGNQTITTTTWLLLNIVLEVLTGSVDQKKKTQKKDI